MTLTKLGQKQLNDYNFNYGLSRNAIINGNFDVWQRGTSVAAADATVQFLADRWRHYTADDGGTLPTLTFSRQQLTAGSIPNAFFNYRIAANGTGTSLGNSSLANLAQKIENGTRNLAGDGKKVTVSFWARSDIAGKRLGLNLTQNYGTGGSPTADEVIKGGTITLTSAWVKYTKTFTTNTLSGKTFGTTFNDSLNFEFWYQWGTTTGNTFVETSVTAETYGNGYVDIAQVQLCVGDVALPFMPKSEAQEKIDCQRYCRPLGNDAYFRQTPYTANQLYYNIPINTMRTKPTVILGTEGTDWQIYTINATAQTGFSLNTTYGGVDSITLEMIKTSHGLTDSYLFIKTANKNFLTAEL